MDESNDSDKAKDGGEGAVEVSIAIPARYKCGGTGWCLSDAWTNLSNTRKSELSVAHKDHAKKNPPYAHEHAVEKQAPGKPRSTPTAHSPYI